MRRNVDKPVGLWRSISVLTLQNYALFSGIVPKFYGLIR